MTNQPDDMVERISVVLCKSSQAHRCDECAQLLEHGCRRADYEPTARAVLRELEESTEAMCDAGLLASGGRRDSLEVWQAMVKAARGEG